MKIEQVNVYKVGHAAGSGYSFNFVEDSDKS